MPNTETENTNKVDNSNQSFDYEGISDEEILSFHSNQAKDSIVKSDFGFQTMPIFLIFLFGGTIFWAAVYLAKNTGEFREDIFSAEDLYAVQEDVVPVFDEVKFIGKGEKLYTSRCAACHQGSGKGLPPAFPPLAESRWVTGDAGIPAKLILLGLAGPIEVKGVNYNGAMPAFGEILKDKDIAAILSYIRTSWGNEAPIVMEEEVANYRAQVGDRKTTYNIQELLPSN